MSEANEKESVSNQYATKLLLQVKDMFDESCDNYIDPDDFNDSEKATAFIHALSVMMPNIMYQQLTGDETDNLGFTHIANRLAVQFANKD